jgi:hypothetical protein
MALITSAASGNFSAGATWTGGVVPTVGDEARASTGHTVTIDVDTTCDEISNAGTGTFTLNGGITLTANVTHKSSTSGVTLLTYSSSTASSIVGTCTGATQSLSGQNNLIRNAGSGTLTITGNCTSGVAANSVAATNASAGNISITGNVTAGAGSFAGPAVQNISTGNIIITGDCTASNAGNVGAGANNTSTGSITVIGTITAAQNNAGIQSTSSGPLLLTGPFIAANNGRLAVYAAFWRWASTLVSSTYFEIPTSDLLANRSLVTEDNVTGMPAEADVKDGVVYGPASALTGTFEQTVAPSANDIRDAVWGAATSSLTAAGSIGERLKNASTVATNSDQLAAALTAP